MIEQVPEIGMLIQIMARMMMLVIVTRATTCRRSGVMRMPMACIADCAGTEGWPHP